MTSNINEARAKASEHREQTGHEVIETNTSTYAEIGVTLICQECDWVLSDEWPRGQHGPTADYGDG